MAFAVFAVIRTWYYTLLLTPKTPLIHIDPASKLLLLLLLRQWGWSSMRYGLCLHYLYLFQSICVTTTKTRTGMQYVGINIFLCDGSTRGRLLFTCRTYHWNFRVLLAISCPFLFGAPYSCFLQSKRGRAIIESTKIKIPLI